MIDTTFTELLPIVGTKGACMAVGRSRATWYRRDLPPRQGPPAPRPTPPNALTPDERDAVREVLVSERFVDRAPAQAWATLLDEGTYLASGSTMYRLLRERGGVRERRRQAVHPPRTVPELVATRPNEVWSYDATALRGPRKGIWYDLFLMLDIFSRCCTGWMVVEGQEAQVVRDWIAGVVTANGPIPEGTLTIHADRGPAMTSKTVAELLSDLRIGRTHGRPHVSNDDPYSEAGFKTLKYAPDFPGNFASILDARAFVGPWLDFYNHEHRHSGIGYHTPASVHLGTAGLVRAERALVLDAAYAAHPERFVNKRPEPPKLPGPAWINPPKETPAQS
ncbi:MAG: DDE-type integrase/transposase/recombinase [Chloroflexi bacterium]|nr:DDE-type integrase/transposase/recombinase [Chloroflexota bacterium]